ncbi:MAG: alpha-glucan phosphorylase [Deltaproteobacteria bacterium HGW-Deltaproteobacteria-14]|jgi:starch phosphorylase|nr:MAG: alpha-glucan phosphorylase [Deltaproteobacteria bacterium HGW-Deltaproteobacteria-14]
MPRIHTFSVAPAIPEALRPLEALAHDLSWSWHPEAMRLFWRIDPQLWRELNGNPVALLGQVGQDRLEALAEDPAFMAHLARVREIIAVELTRPSAVSGEGAAEVLVAYFCAEFGLSEALPIYSGGLGVLAGDTLKSASGVGLPFVAVGLAYQEGYFHQYLNVDGWQQEDPYDNDFATLPMRRARRPDGSAATVEVRIEGRRVKVRIWEVTVGRTRLLLLDTNDPENTADDRAITYRLYGGGSELRCKQEIVLGIGGFYALRTMGVRPTVYHMNEGHSAFMALARIRDLVQASGLSFAEAREACAATNVFTTHTPVPAGFDVFSEAQLAQFLPTMHDDLGVSRRELLALGAHEQDPGLTRGFNMAYLALRLSGWVNGVSQLHADVSREMWRRMWPGYEANEVPIVGVTNGVHTRTWLDEEMGELLERYLGEGVTTAPATEVPWELVDSVPDAELWRAHERARERLVSFVRERATRQARRLGLPPHHIEAATEVLDPRALTIGFARRFATYKRATLLFRERDRIRALLTNERRPVQFVFAGKAHPQDDPAKELIKELVHFARDPAIRRHIVFVEEYDMGVARHLVQGVDVWLNNPRRPKEASGTSGMKVVPNGGLNLSVLDGWWAEAYDGLNGWAIGAGEVYDDVEQGDEIESRILLNLLEDQVLPEFYGRGPDGLPRRWIARMKHSMKGLSSFFSTDRMVLEYAEKLYLPATRAGLADAASDHAVAREVAARVGRLETGWGQVRIGDVQVNAPYDLTIGEAVTLEAPVFLGDLAADDVIVEVVGGRVDSDRQVVDGITAPMQRHDEGDIDGWYRYHGTWTPQETGHSGCTLRVRPRFDRGAPARDFPVKLWE